MYYVDSAGTERCKLSLLDDENARRYEGEDSKFCTYQGTFIKIYSMFVAGLDEYLFTNGAVEERNWRIADHDMQYSTMWVSFLFGLLVQILLLNVIIVIVNESWDDVSRHGTEIFWEHRLNALLEVKAFGSWRIPPKAHQKRQAIARRMNRISERILELIFFGNSRAKQSVFDYMLSLQHDGFLLQSYKEWKTASAEAWLRCVVVRTLLVLKVIHHILIFTVLVALSFFGGLMTLGILWPRSFRSFLFGSNEMDNESNIPGEMSREIRMLHKQCDNYEKMLKESTKYHEVLREKDVELKFINAQLQQQERSKLEKEEDNVRAAMEEMKRQYDEMFRLQLEANNRLEEKLSALMQMLQTRPQATDIQNISK